MSHAPAGRTGTIRDDYRSMVDEPDAAHQAHAYMKNVDHTLRLVFWETTVGCNLECIHCRRLEVSRELAKSDLTTEESFAFLDSLAAFARPILVLSGGEPLFRPDIYAIARYATTRGLTVAMATNGTLVDVEVAEKIKASGVQRVSISLDGATAAVHDTFRRIPGSFAAAVRGLRHCQAAGLETQINSTVARHNVHELEALYRLALALGVKALHLFMLVPVGCGVEIADDQMLPATQYEEVLNWLYDIAQEKKIETKATCAPHYFRIMRQRAKADGIRITPQTHGMAAMTKGCLAGSAVCFVSHKGEVFPCGFLPVPCGNVRFQPFRAIWEESTVFAALRDPDRLEGKCGLCEFKKVCLGCRARASYEAG
ncbi:MAG: radical SAM protein, partial [Candidatus Tectimicrobiota bacterium]